MKEVILPEFQATIQIETSKEGGGTELIDVLKVQDAFLQFLEWYNELLERLPIAMGKASAHDNSRALLVANIKDVGTEKSFRCRLINLEELPEEVAEPNKYHH